jgi:hypothetical protein
MSEAEGKEEITVKAPSRSIIDPEKKAEQATERALEEERYGVLGVPKKIGRFFGGISLGAGMLLFALLAYSNVSGQTSLVFLSSASSLPIVALWLFVGLISVVVGFILMGSE